MTPAHRCSVRRRGVPLLAALLAATVALALTGCEGDSEAPAEVTPAVASPVATAATHVVVRGETLAIISRLTGVPLARLAELNDIADRDVIETGLVLLLEEAPPAPSAGAEADAKAPEAKRDALLDWAREQWERLPKPELTLTDDALSQGAVAGLMLPAAVIAFVVLWVLAIPATRLGRRLVRLVRRTREGAPAVPRTAPAAPAAPDATSAAPGASGGVPGMAGGATAAGAGVAAMTAPARRLPSLAPLRHALLAAPRSAGRALGRGLGQGLGHTLRGGKRLALATGRRVAAVPRRAGSQLARDRQRQRLERQRVASRERWWKHGTETLRIGLLDEAERHFRAGLMEADRNGWSEEQQLYADGLAQVEERRRGERMALGAATPSTPDTADDPAGH
ncbi:MAG: hypothetical protein GEU80_16670 [Dehalococcoidia bacterium]|nr:hypothetical protein [Dehalococcoidia bacterium]